MAVTVLPDNRNQMTQALLQMLAQSDARRAETERQKLLKEEADRNYQLNLRKTDAEVGNLGAATDKTKYDVSSDRAGKIVKPIIDNYNAIMANGGPDASTKATAYVEAAAGRFANDPEVQAHLGGFLSSRPTLDTDIRSGHLSKWTADTAGRVAEGGQNAMDVNLATKMAVGEQLSAPAFGNQEQREMGPDALSSAMAIKSDRQAGATPKLQAGTQASIAAADRASRERIAREGIASNERLAQARTSAEANGVAPPEQAEMKAETASMIRELINHPGREAATGSGLTSGSRLFGLKDEPLGGTDAAGFVSKLNTVKARLTLDNLKLLKGAMSDKDLLFLNSVPAALETGLGDEEFLGELKRVLGKLEGGASVITPEDGAAVRAVADKHFGGDVAKAEAYLRSKGKL